MERKLRMLVYGPPLSGKTTLVNGIRNALPHVNFDFTESVAIPTGVDRNFDMRLYVHADQATCIGRIPVKSENAILELADKYESAERDRIRADLIVQNTECVIELIKSYCEHAPTA